MSKRSLSRGVALGLILLGITAWCLPGRSYKPAVITHAATPQPTTPPEVSSAQYAVPAVLHIDAINVNAPVVPVGLTATGTMEAPRTLTEVGWYSLGVKPGELGASILVGHFDGFTSPYGVFRRLKELTPGTALTVTDVDGQVHIFHVLDVRNYPRQAVPLEMLLTSREARRLVLITCSGAWDWRAGTYADRLVVTAELI